MGRVEQVRKRSANVKRDLSCVFNNMDQKILVTRRYISELQQKAAAGERHREGNHANSDSRFSNESGQFLLSSSGRVAGVNFFHSDGEEILNLPDEDRIAQEAENPESELINPLASGPPTFMSPGNGRMFYLGTSSNWSFARRVLSLAHQHVHNEALPTETLIFEGPAYDLSWDGSRTVPMLENPVIPSLDHATYLINAVKFRCGQLYHLLDEDNFTRSLHDFYADGGQTGKDSLHKRRPSGIDYFVKALQILPEQHRLCSSPMTSTEILCCVALFYQSLDCRSPAHNYVGQAMRMAMSYGMHTRMPIGDSDQQVVERCQKIWWTVYILDRHLTSIQGLPQSVDDHFVQTDLPSFMGSPEKIATMSMHIKLCRSLADISSTVYAIDGRLNRTFLLSTKAALSNLAKHADELHEAFPLCLDGTEGISRTSAYLHLFYQQCVIVATRPLLFCFLKIRLESPATCLEFLKESRNVRNLIRMCLESAQHSITILHGLRSQGLLETFLTFDLESVLISTVVLLMGPTIDTLLVNNHLRWLEKAYAIFREMVKAGNEVAQFRCLVSVSHLLSPSTSHIPALMDQNSCNDRPPIAEAPLAVECVFGPMLTSAEMMTMADSIELYDAEWVSNAMMHHNIW
ncbi:hypothetical protein BDV11DRAFT_205570 [Aspergillus similis]